jgi:hypothetical protein
MQPDRERERRRTVAKATRYPPSAPTFVAWRRRGGRLVSAGAPAQPRCERQMTERTDNQ